MTLQATPRATPRATHKKGANTLSRHRARQARADFASYGEAVPHAAQATPAPTGPSMGTHGVREPHCPGSIAFKLLGGHVFKPGA